MKKEWKRRNMEDSTVEINTTEKDGKAFEYAKDHGILDYKVKGNRMVYYQNVHENDSVVTYKITVRLDTMMEERKKLNKFYEKGDLNVKPKMQSMTIEGLKSRLALENLLSVKDHDYDGCIKEYIDGGVLFNNGPHMNILNAFTIQKDNDQYSFVFTDNKNGLPYCIRSFNSEAAACEALYEKILEMKKEEI